MKFETKQVGETHEAWLHLKSTSVLLITGTKDECEQAVQENETDIYQTVKDSITNG